MNKTQLVLTSVPLLLVSASTLAQGKIPGRIEAEDYNPGGEGVGYHDTTFGNFGNSYRLDDVDIIADRRASHGYAVSWIVPGEWLKYDLMASSSGLYQVTIGFASALPGKRIRLELDGDEGTGVTVLPATGGARAFKMAPLLQARLSEGHHVLRVFFESGDFVFDFLDFTLVKSMPVARPSPSPHPGPVIIVNDPQAPAANDGAAAGGPTREGSAQ